VRTVAPAKINWTLEVLGRRHDGYHEIRSVMQTIDLWDEFWADRSDEPIFETTARKPLSDDDLIVLAARALEERLGRALPARIRVEKRIPVASGLGGGSSDAAATLRLLNRLYRLNLSREEVVKVAACLGSDVPFFVYGGTALVEGRGERVTPLRDIEPSWFVLLVPPVAPHAKTAAMYASLAPGDFSDGTTTYRAVKTIQADRTIGEWDLRNAFARAAYGAFADLGKYREAIVDAGGRAIDLAGSGPGLFASFADSASAKQTADAIKAGGGKVILARTVGAHAATAVTD
jgi:4-diphosphocytidyl-2-C-methyl-D-erythritol kinase